MLFSSDFLLVYNQGIRTAEKTKNRVGSQKSKVGDVFFIVTPSPHEQQTDKQPSAVHRVAVS